MRLRRSFVHASLAVAVLASASLPAAGDWQDSYRKGMQAQELGDWRAAVSHFEQAIRERAQAGGSVRLPGMRFEEYTPYYWLGMAYEKVGRPLEAKKALLRSKRENAIEAGSKSDRKRAQILARVIDTHDPDEIGPEVMARAKAEVKKANDYESALRKKKKDPEFGNLPKELRDGVNELFNDRSRIAARLANAKTEGDYQSVTKDARELNRDFTTASGNIDKGFRAIVARKIDSASNRVSGLILEAKKRGEEMTGQRDQALAKNPPLRDDWGKTGQTLTTATDLLKEGSASLDLQQIDEAGKLAQQVDVDRKNIIAQVDQLLEAEDQKSVLVANQDIARQEKEARSLVDRVLALDSPGPDVLSEKAALERLLIQLPANDASPQELGRYARLLEGRNGHLVSAINAERERISLAHKEQVESAKDDARGALARAAKIDSPSPALPLSVEIVEKLLAEPTPGDGYPTQLRQAVDDLEVAMVPSTIDHRLAKAYQAYIKCDYRGVETALAGATFDKPWLNVQANLFRAAALFARYVHGGKQVDSLRERARQAVGECLRLDPDYRPREEVFPPPFLAFYRES